MGLRRPYIVALADARQICLETNRMLHKQACKVSPVESSRIALLVPSPMLKKAAHTSFRIRVRIGLERDSRNKLGNAHETHP